MRTYPGTVRHYASIAIACFLSWFCYPAQAQVTPPAPTNLTAYNIPGPMPGVDLHWQTNPGQWFFKVYRSQGDTNNFRHIGMSMMPSFQDRQVLFSNTYHYYVTAVVFQDTTLVESPRSNIAAITVSSTRPQGIISGTVVDDETGLPIANVRIRFYRNNGQSYWLPPVQTNTLGQYQARLDTGTYLVKAEPPMRFHEPPAYRPEWYDNVPSPATATPVRVRESTNTVVDFGLAPNSQFSLAMVEGVVTTEQGIPVPNATVALMRPIQEMYQLAATTGTEPGTGIEARYIPGVGYCRGVLWSGRTNVRGQYRAMVPNEAHYIALAAKPGYLPEYFSNQSDPTQAAIINVDDHVFGLNFRLEPMPNYQNSIRGIVRDSTGVPVPARVILFPRPRNSSSAIRFVHTDSIGFYEINRAAPGSYIMLAVPFSSFAPAFYKANDYGIINWEIADSIRVTGIVSNINVGVVPIMSCG